MLRLLLLAGALLLLIVGAACLALGPIAPAIWLFAIGGMILAGTLFERAFYKPVRSEMPLGPGWARTKERFIDPETDKTVEVFYNATSGERQYVSRETRRR